MTPGVVKVIDYDFNISYLALLEEWLDVQEKVDVSEVWYIILVETVSLIFFNIDEKKKFVFCENIGHSDHYWHPRSTRRHA